MVTLVKLRRSSVTELPPQTKDVRILFHEMSRDRKGPTGCQRLDVGWVGRGP
jgi:hypothetical protein